MPRAINLTGQRFGRLTVVRSTGKTDRDGRIWLCQCDCGNEAEKTVHALRSGHVMSCGCAHIDRIARLKFKDLTGMVFGRLTVIARRGVNRQGLVAWACRCACGEDCEAVGSYLVKGDTRSCGCLRADMVASSNRKKRLPAEEREAREKERGRLKYERKSSDSSWMLAERVRAGLRRSLRKLDAEKDRRTFDMLGYTPCDLARHMERQFSNGMAWENFGQWHIDHIVPICTARTRDDVVRLNQLPNLRPLWRDENLAKLDKRLFLI